jgi:TFIIF-interacting CTD phosphatase-like protein
MSVFSSNKGGTSSSSSTSATSTTTEIVLPSNDYILQSWKVEAGSSVRVGETIAIAVRIDSLDKDGGNVGGEAPSSTTTQTASHKRPQRRQPRMTIPPSTSAAAPKNIHTKTPITTDAPAFEWTAKRMTQKFSMDTKTSSSSKEQPTPATPQNAPVADNASTTTATGDAHASTISIVATSNGLLRVGSQLQHSSSSATSSPQPIDPKDNKLLVIGYIEECMHPGFLEGLCVRCGISLRNDSKDDARIPIPPPILDTSQQRNGGSSFTQLHEEDNDIDKDPFSQKKQPQLSQVTVSGGITMTVSKSEGQRMAQQSFQRLWKLRKLHLVLDLDHTLVHATSDHRAQQYAHGHANHNPMLRTLLLPFHGEPVAAPLGTTAGFSAASSTTTTPPTRQIQWMQHYVKLRPHIKEFLTSLAPFYEITVYTAGTRQYAEEITIVVCRHMVGATRDYVDLEQMRYQVQRAETEHQKYQQHLKVVNANATNAAANATLRQEEKVQEEVEEEDQKKPAAKRKRSFDNGNTDNGNDANDDNDDNDDNNGEEVTNEHAAAAAAAVITENGNKPAKKKRKVTFEPSLTTTNGENGDSQSKGKNESPRPNLDHDQQQQQQHVMTLEKLQELKEELKNAESMEAKAWELRQRLFGSRVVSRTDVGDLGHDVKSLKRIFPCGGTMAAVVDDREDVWANAIDNSHDTVKGEPPDNLLLVRPYHWQPFIGFADVNNVSGVDLSGGSPSSGGKDPDHETDKQLPWTGNILKELHKRYYSPRRRANQMTVPDVLTEMRREVLKGVTLVLSGLVPLHKQNGSANSVRPSMVRYAQSLGSKVVDQVQVGVTHVVAAKDGTGKALAARKISDCLLVKASWLIESYWSMKRQDEKQHLLAPGAADKARMQEPLKEAKVENSTSGGSSADSEDDDLAAEFEDEFMDI